MATAMRIGNGLDGRHSRVIAMLALVALGLAACNSQTNGGANASAGAGKSGRAGPGGDANRPVPVGIGVLSKGDLPVSVTALGTVTPLATVTVKSRVDGQIMAIHFTEGQMVRAGDVLAEIDPRPFNVQYEQAVGQLNRDKALLETAKIDLERYRLLFTQDSIAKQQLDAQQSLVHQYEGAVRSDAANVASARLQQTYGHVTAPVSGRVGLRQVDVGNVVHAGDTTGLVVITQLKPIAIVGTVPEDRLPALMKRLQAHEPIPVQAFDRANSALIARGTLLTVDNEIDVTTGTIKVKAQFTNDDLALFPNQFVNLKVEYGALKSVILAPAAAVQQGPDGAFVYAVKDDSSVHLEPVKVLSTVGETTALDTTLAPGTRVVTDGIDRLKDGATIKAKDSAPSEPGRATPPSQRKSSREQK